MPQLTVHPRPPRPAKLPPRPKSKPVHLYARAWVVSPGVYADALIAEGRLPMAYGGVGIANELRISENVGHAEGYRCKD